MQYYVILCIGFKLYYVILCIGFKPYYVILCSCWV